MGPIDRFRWARRCDRAALGRADAVPMVADGAPVMYGTGPADAMEVHAAAPEPTTIRRRPNSTLRSDFAWYASGASFGITLGAGAALALTPDRTDGGRRCAATGEHHSPVAVSGREV